jgi:thioredoxin-related protein
MKKTIGILILIFTLNSIALAQNEGQAKVNWVTFEEAIALNQKEKRKILVDVYTDWCGWCKKMDRTTYSHPKIVEYINEKYYAVKLDAEMTDTVRLGNQVFVNENPGAKRSPHQLAVSLLNGKMGYPSTVFLDEKIELLNPPISGYLSATSIEPILHYFGENIYSTKEMGWEEFQQQFKGKVE